MVDITVERLKRAIGNFIENHRGTILGKLVEIKCDEDRTPRHLILCCPNLRGNQRYFAVPATSSLIEINQQDKIKLWVDEEVLRIVLGISASKYSNADSKASGSLFELYGYQDST